MQALRFVLWQVLRARALGDRAAWRVVDEAAEA
jgi:hypothetical protein